MSIIGRLRRRSAEERRLLVHAALLHTLVAVLLPLVRYGRLMRWGGAVYRPSAAAIAVRPDRVVWAVESASATLPPGGTCLSRAIAAHWLLARGGRASTIQFGVAPHPVAPVAHAWLEVDGQPILGAPSPATRYTTLHRAACCS
jgi:hypothetical protein